ncbi:hypothetical protein SLA2020_284980 [Shorea laevis]
MSLVIASKSGVMQQRLTFLWSKFVESLCKSLAISGVVLYLFYIILSKLSNHPCCRSSALLANLRYTSWSSSSSSSSSIVDSPTNISHLVFGIASSAKTWERFALSYPLAQVLVKNLDVCIKTYPTLYGSDHILQSCIADLGVSLTQEKGFHQIDLHSDISGLLSALPQSPSVSLHHLDVVDPIFPSITNRQVSLNHLMEAAKADQSRILQQTICYHKQSNWSFSISWGYSAHIYEKFFHQAFYIDPSKHFRHGRSRLNHPTCLTLDFPPMTHVLSPAGRHGEAGNRRECCDVVRVAENLNFTEVMFRACMKDEIVAYM